MIPALANADWERWKAPPQASRQKKDALFELATRVALIAERARESEGASLALDAKVERRRILRYGLELLAEGADAERLDQGYELAPVFRELDPGTRLELAAVRGGLGAIAAGEHPFFVLRRMTAFLGPDYYDKASAWIAGRLKRRRRKPQSLLVPGDLPDLIRNLALDPRSLERCIRAMGRNLSAAALAGSPQESVDLVTAFFGKAGGAAFEDDAAYLRGRLSGEEIAQAQSAFIDVAKSLESLGELEIGDEDEFASDPAYVKELSQAIMALDDRLIKAAFKKVDSRLLALAMQGMEPRAHNRILGLLAKREARHLLDAIDDAAILPWREILEAGKLLAKAVIAPVATAASSPPKALEAFERIRDWKEAAPPNPSLPR